MRMGKKRNSSATILSANAINPSRRRFAHRRTKVRRRGNTSCTRPSPPQSAVVVMSGGTFSLEIAASRLECAHSLASPPPSQPPPPMSPMLPKTLKFSSFCRQCLPSSLQLYLTRPSIRTTIGEDGQNLCSMTILKANATLFARRFAPLLAVTATSTRTLPSPTFPTPSSPPTSFPLPSQIRQWTWSSR